jgi:hypothetical protein
VIDYFIDSGYEPHVAQKKVNKMSDARVCSIYDNEPYFEENGK